MHQTFQRCHFDGIGHEVPHQSQPFEVVYPARITECQQQSAGCQDQHVNEPEIKAQSEEEVRVSAIVFLASHVDAVTASPRESRTVQRRCTPARTPAHRPGC
jgi:hypothetical protein